MPRHRARSTALRLAGAGVTIAALPRQGEASFMAQVVAYAGLLGWHHYHTHDSRHSVAGFPDLVLVRRPRLLFVELKREGEYPTDAQRQWLDELKACDTEAYLWWPTDWEVIERILR